MPTIIRAAVCRAFGEPLAVEEVVLADPGPDELRVAVEAVAVCHSDVSDADGEWGGELPAVQGHEAAGTVVECGPDVDLEIGQRVVVALIRSCGTCARCERGDEVACLGSFDLDVRSPLTDVTGASIRQATCVGGFAEQVVVHRSQVVPIGGDVPAPSAALLACGVITGVGAVLNTARVERGSTVVVVGCGGVGLNVVQGAVIAGASTIVAIDPEPSKHARAHGLGATHAIDPTAADARAEVARLTGGAMADYVFIATGAPAAMTGAEALVGRAGALVIVGMPATGVGLMVDPSMLAADNRRILGSRMGTSVIARDIPDLVARYRTGELELDGLVSGTFRLEDVNLAMDGVRAGTALRNVIVFGEEQR